MGLNFEWDTAKSLKNAAKHHVSFSEASTVFGDSLAIRIPDPDHSFDEDRFVLIGKSEKNRVLVVVYCKRGHNTIRIISARRATRAEVMTYNTGLTRRLTGE